MALYARESGPGDAPSIVLLHGGGASGWTWQLQLEHLGDYHCLVPDLPEHGKSLAEGPFSIKGAAEQVLSLIRERTHGGRAHVVGLSLGGQVAAQILASGPEVVDHAILSGTSVRLMPGMAIFSRPAMVKLTEAIVRLWWPFRDRAFWVHANMKYYSIPPRFEPEYREELCQFTPGALMRITVGESLRFRLPPGIGRAQAPTLVVVGQREYGVVYQSARDLVAALPHAHGCIAARVGHNWSLEAPELFTQMIRAWITDQPLPAELLPLK